MAQDDVAALTRAVEKLHGARATFIGSTPVHEQFEGKTVWQGTVSRFELAGHPTATLCYAWSVPATDDRRERFVAVLHTPDVDSAEKAVRAAIVAEHRSGRT